MIVENTCKEIIEHVKLWNSMSNQQDKRLLRTLKKQIKQDGNKRHRRELNRQLLINPNDAHLTDYQFNYDSSTMLNGLFVDATKKHPSDSL